MVRLRWISSWQRFTTPAGKHKSQSRRDPALTLFRDDSTRNKCAEPAGVPDRPRRGRDRINLLVMGTTAPARARAERTDVPEGERNHLPADVVHGVGASVHDVKLCDHADCPAALGVHLQADTDVIDRFDVSLISAGIYF